jgi:hypothetical protein
MPIEFRSLLTPLPAAPSRPAAARLPAGPPAGAPDGFEAALASTTAAPADAPGVVDPSGGTAAAPVLPAESGFAQAGASPPIGALPAEPATTSPPADQAAPAPSDPSMLDPRERTRAFTRRDWRPQPDGQGFHPFSEDGFTFDDVIDVINPLQHIPIVSAVYRWLTGDKISPAAELAGGALFGGAIGLAGAAGSLVLDGLTGGETDQQVMVALFGPSPAGASDGSGDGLGGTEDLAAATPPVAARGENVGAASSRGAGLATATLLAMVPDDTRPAAVQTSAAPVGSAAAALAMRPPAPPATPFPATMPTGAGEIAASAPPAGLQPARALKLLPPPLPPTTSPRQPPPIDTSGLSASLPTAIDAARPSAIPAAMTRALDSYRKLLEQRDRAAVPAPGLDFQS